MRGKDWRGEHKAEGCEFAVEASLHRLIIEVEMKSNITAGGIELPQEVVDKEAQAHMKAKVLAIGANAWADKARDAADVGDTIIIGRYVGTRLQDIDSGRDVRLVSDLDVLAVAEYA